jgi:hypothetical protein
MAAYLPDDKQEKRSSIFFTPAAPFTRGSVVLTGRQMRQNLHSWLSPPDSSTNHNIACNAHHDGTATWFFQGSIFEEWKSTPSLLWIHGKRMFYHSLQPSTSQTCILVAGSGKSVLWLVSSP